MGARDLLARPVFLRQYYFHATAAQTACLKKMKDSKILLLVTIYSHN